MCNNTLLLEFVNLFFYITVGSSRAKQMKRKKNPQATAFQKMNRLEKESKGVEQMMIKIVGKVS